VKVSNIDRDLFQERTLNIVGIAAFAQSDRWRRGKRRCVQSNGARVTDDYLARFESAWRPLDPQQAAVLAMIYRRYRGTRPVHELSPAEARALDVDFSFFISAGAPAIPHIEERVIAAPSGPIRLRLYDPGVPAPAPVVVFFHGGGFVTCDIDIYDGTVRQLAKRCGMRLVAADYGLAPEHPFPMPLKDCIAAVRHVEAHAGALGIDARRLTLAGDSAGANLALATALALRDEGGSPVRAAALIYGCFTTSTASVSHRDYGAGAYLMSTADMVWYWRHYLPEGKGVNDPLAEPLLADLAGLPPLHIAAAEFDVLRADSEELATRARDAGVAVEYELWSGMIHASLNLMGFIDAMGRHVDAIGRFLRANSE
jgi:acetyl esterase